MKKGMKKGVAGAFADALTNISHSRRVVMRALAAELGVTPQTMSNWRCGKNEPTFAQLCRIADALDCTTDELLGRVRYSGGVSVSGSPNAVNNSSVNIGGKPCTECAKKDALIAAQAETIKNLSAALARR